MTLKLPTALVIAGPPIRFQRRSLTARCAIVRVESLHVVLRAPDGAELWAQRTDGSITGSHGGFGGGSRVAPVQWQGWTVAQWHALAWFAVDPDETVWDRAAAHYCLRCRARFHRGQGEPHRLCPECRSDVPEHGRVRRVRRSA